MVTLRTRRKAYQTHSEHLYSSFHLSQKALPNLIAHRFPFVFVILKTRPNLPDPSCEETPIGKAGTFVTAWRNVSSKSPMSGISTLCVLRKMNSSAPSLQSILSLMQHTFLFKASMYTKLLELKRMP